MAQSVLFSNNAICIARFFATFLHFEKKISLDKYILQLADLQRFWNLSWTWRSLLQRRLTSSVTSTLVTHRRNWCGTRTTKKSDPEANTPLSTEMRSLLWLSGTRQLLMLEATGVKQPTNSDELRPNVPWSCKVSGNTPPPPIDFRSVAYTLRCGNV